MGLRLYPGASAQKPNFTTVNGKKISPFVAILVAVVVIVGGALGYFGFSAYTSYQTVSQEYDARVTQLHSLQNRVPFPSAANLTAITEASAQFKAVFDNLLDRAAALNAPLDEIGAQDFQDRLRAVVSEVKTAATNGSVALPEGFYMGFNQYENSLPSERAAGPLARQLASFQFIVDKLIALRVTSIDNIERTPLPEEGRADAADAPVPVVQALPFRISFTAEQGRLRQALNGIVTADRFFIIRAITVSNSAPSGPPRNQDLAVAQPGSALPADIFGTAEGTAAEGEPEQPALNVLVGRETLSVTANMELVLINPPAEPAEQK